ncbi:MAG: bifunctional 4-hydroxy-2-oxoglutarate aldolase/2-dehydro-3-deoxy-phosphogluconate aldolase [Phycisphaerae bacterium]|nr:bifunctional 4-hydroxy-2-oxoglutarate aldolase/2-dehydro-3-deoxy-phosphogluconate aldolase [Phycisphaerae bacterium]
MSRPHEVVAEMERTGVVAVVRADSSAQLIDVVAALYKADLTCVEITMTTPNALDVIKAASKEFAGKCLIGVGTVLDAETARAAILAGAEYVVAPTLDVDTITLCKRYGKAVVPGCFTPTEILRAWQAGADVIKVFPATKLGPDFFKDVRGPLPQVRMTPTGGVSLENTGDFIKAGAVCVGVGSAMVTKKALAAGDFETITKNAAAFLKAVADARAK